jgi:glycosyltransferase involved in cell wall biosynthesis
MGNQIDVSVILCTYNRCGMLPNALERILDRAVDGINYEVIGVDNNSSR